MFFLNIFEFLRLFSTKCSACCFNRGHSFETLRSLNSWDGKKRKKSFPFNTTDGKSRTKFLRIYVKSHNKDIYYLA